MKNQPIWRCLLRHTIDRLVYLCTTSPQNELVFFISKLGRFFYKEIFTFMIIQSLFGRFIMLFASKIYVDDHVNFKNITYLNMLFKVF